MKLHISVKLNREFFKSTAFGLCNGIQCSLTGRHQRYGGESCPMKYTEYCDCRFDGAICAYLPNCKDLPQIIPQY